MLVKYPVFVNGERFFVAITENQDDLFISFFRLPNVFIPVYKTRVTKLNPVDYVPLVQGAMEIFERKMKREMDNDTDEAIKKFKKWDGRNSE